MAFKVFDIDDMLGNVSSTVAAPMWANNSSTLTRFFTGSIQSSNTGKYYYDVHASDDQTTDVEFSVSYGHRHGSGSEGGTTAGQSNPTKAIYSQVRQVLLPSQTTRFNFNGGGSGSYYSDDVFVIVANRARYREKMDPGNWELHLASGSKRSAGDTSGSHFIKLIDDSGATGNASVGASQREFNVVSGSIADGIYETATTAATATKSGSFGLFYPEMGMVVLNPNVICSGSVIPNMQHRAVCESLGKSSTVNNLNHRKLYNSIKSGSYFASRREEVKRSSFYFCRIPHDQFNHSQNPSYFSGSNAALTNRDFITNPTTYITTVGLYNDNNELLAVAKLSQPFKKDQNTEALIKVRLDY